jgi:hypothetical protein
MAEEEYHPVLTPLPLEIEEMILNRVPTWGFFLRQVCRQWRRERPPVSPSQFAIDMYQGGHLEVILQYRARPCRQRLRLAALSGHTSILTHFTAEVKQKLGPLISQPEYGQESFFLTILSRGQRGTAEWFLDQGYTLPSDSSVAAARGGHLDLLKWLVQEKGCPFDGCSALSAAGGGHLPILQWFCSQGKELPEEIVLWAAGGGSVETVQWLISQGCSYDSRACARAARTGDLSMLQYLRLQHCPWDSSVTSEATASENVKLLQWLWDQEAPFTEGAWIYAIDRQHIPTLDWLLEHRVPYDTTDCKWWCGTRPQSVAWAQEKGLPWGGVELDVDLSLLH